MWHPKRLYSQNFEDLYLSRFFVDVERGFYVDAGAWHPTLDSVTKVFYEQGWRGINIEPLKEAFDLLEAERSEDFNLNLAVSDLQSEGLVSFSVLGDNPLFNGQHFINDSDDQADNKVASKFGFANNRTVQCSNLREIFQQYAVGKQVHFLKLDVEGLEFKALKGLQLELLSDELYPNVILLEATLPDTRLSSHCREDCKNYLEANGYKFLLFDGLNDYYCKISLFDTLSLRVGPPNVFDRPSIGCLAYFEMLSQQDQTQQDFSGLNHQLQAKVVELQKVEGERDALSKEKGEALQTVEDLKKQLEEKDAELQKIVGELDVRVKEKEAELMALQQQLETSQLETKDTRAESELILLQLKQIQEELEHYFLLSRHQDELLSSYSDLQKRIAVLISDSNNIISLD